MRFAVGVAVPGHPTKGPCVSWGSAAVSAERLTFSIRGTPSFFLRLCRQQCGKACLLGQRYSPSFCGSAAGSAGRLAFSGRATSFFLRLYRRVAV